MNNKNKIIENYKSSFNTNYTKNLENKLIKSNNINKTYKEFLINKIISINKNLLEHPLINMEKKRLEYLLKHLQEQKRKFKNSTVKPQDILFVRHGFSCANIHKISNKSKETNKFKEEKYFRLGIMKNNYGTDSVLTELGVLQSFISGLYFDDNGLTPYISSSILIRTIETCFFFLLGQNIKLQEKREYNVHLTTRYREDGITTSDKLRNVSDLKAFCQNLQNPEFIKKIIQKVINNSLINIKNKDLLTTLNENLNDYLPKINFFYKDNKFYSKNIQEINNYNEIYKFNDYNNLRKVLIDDIGRVNKNHNSNYYFLIFSHSKTIRNKICGINKKKGMLNGGIYNVGNLHKIKNVIITPKCLNNNNYFINSNNKSCSFGRCTLINKDIIYPYQYGQIYSNKNLFVHEKDDLCENSIKPQSINYYKIKSN